MINYINEKQDKIYSARKRALTGEKKVYRLYNSCFDQMQRELYLYKIITLVIRFL